MTPPLRWTGTTTLMVGSGHGVLPLIPRVVDLGREFLVLGELPGDCLCYTAHEQVVHRDPHPPRLPDRPRDALDLVKRGRIAGGPWLLALFVRACTAARCGFGKKKKPAGVAPARRKG